MPLVIGAFTTLMEAEAAAQALLDAGYEADAIAALARVGGGRLRLAGRIAMRPVGEPARLANRTERVGASALIGGMLGALLAAAIVLLLPRMGIDLLAPAREALPGPVLVAAAVLFGALLLGSIGALVPRTQGLPHDLAFRYALRLDQGDTLLAVRAVAARQARAAQETLALHGAIQAHVTRGTLEAVGDTSLAVGLAPSEN